MYNTSNGFKIFFTGYDIVMNRNIYIQLVNFNNKL